MAQPSVQSDAELLQQLLGRLALNAITPKSNEDAAALKTLQDGHAQLGEVMKDLKATQQKHAVQQILMRDQSDKLFHKVESAKEDIQEQLSIFNSLKSKITLLEGEKKEDRAILSTLQDDLRLLRLQVAAKGDICVLKESRLTLSNSRSPDGKAQQIEQIEDEVVTDAANVTQLPSDPVTHAFGTGLQVPLVPANVPRGKETPEIMMPLPNYYTPKSLTTQAVPSPGTVGTAMPDTPGFAGYDGPASIPPKPLSAESSETVGENANKRVKRVLRTAIVTRKDLVFPPIADTKQLALEPLKRIDKTLWREAWEQNGKPGSLEDFARRQKLATMHSTDINGLTRPRKRLTASDLEQLSTPLENTRKRGRDQSMDAQSMVPTARITPPSVPTTNVNIAGPRKTRAGRNSILPARISGKDMVKEKIFVTPITITPLIFASKSSDRTHPCAEIPDAAQKAENNVRLDAIEDEDPETPGRAASTLLQKFGSRKTKLPKNAAK